MTEIIVGYARVSTIEQANETHALEQQIARLKNAGATKIYCDVVSGSRDDRKEFTQLLEDIAGNKVDKVLATRWDRLTRSEEGYPTIKKFFKESNVTLELLDQGEVDLSTASGELMSDIQCIMAVHERRMLQERVRHGFKHRRNRHAAAGRPPFGYTVVNEQYQLDKRPLLCLLAERPENYQDYEHEIDSSHLPGISKADIAADVIHIFLETHLTRRVIEIIHDKYGVIPTPGQNSSYNEDLVLPRSANQLRQWLTNPVLEGHTAYLKYSQKGKLKPRDQWEIHEHTHPDHVLVTPEMAEEIQDILKLNRKKIANPKRSSHLTGLVFCSHCGNKCMARTARDRKYKYYSCRYTKQGCPNVSSIRFETIEEAMISSLFTRAMEFQEAQAPSPGVDCPELVALQDRLAYLEKTPGAEDDPLISNAISNLRQQIQTLTTQITNEVPLTGTAQQILSHPLARNLFFWYGLTESERSQFYLKLVEKVLVADKNVTAVLLKI